MVLGIKLLKQSGKRLPQLQRGYLSIRRCMLSVTNKAGQKNKAAAMWSTQIIYIFSLSKYFFKTGNEFRHTRKSPQLQRDYLRLKRCAMDVTIKAGQKNKAAAMWSTQIIYIFSLSKYFFKTGNEIEYLRPKNARLAPSAKSAFIPSRFFLNLLYVAFSFLYFFLSAKIQLLYIY